MVASGARLKKGRMAACDALRTGNPHDSLRTSADRNGFQRFVQNLSSDPGLLDSNAGPEGQKFNAVEGQRDQLVPPRPLDHRNRRFNPG